VVRGIFEIECLKMMSLEVESLKMIGVEVIVVGFMDSILMHI